jgi:hypothetical protein
MGPTALAAGKPRSKWEDHRGELPVGEATLIGLAVDYLPGDRHPRTAVAMVITRRDNRCRGEPYLTRVPAALWPRARVKPVLGWTRPKLRAPAAANRWTWLILASYAQLRLARGLAPELRLP